MQIPKQIFIMAPALRLICIISKVKKKIIDE